MWKQTIEKTGQRLVNFFEAIYEISQLFLSTLKSLTSIWFYRRQVIDQFYVFLVKTLPIAAVIAVFIGLGSMIQGTYQSSTLVPRTLTMNVIFKSIIFEVTPIVLSLVLAGKLGASLAAEIGSMKISEQLEALETLALDPTGFLVMPRVLAGVFMLPIITIFANFIAIFSVFFVSSVISDWISQPEFFDSLQTNLRIFEFYYGNFIKPAVFGLLISLVGSYFGLKTRGGALGVGKASTNAVVVSAILIVFFDYYLARVLL
jgi:phospholipid/cholesterol/gamma-HCH transport system permease protein